MVCMLENYQPNACLFAVDVCAVRLSAVGVSDVCASAVGTLLLNNARGTISDVRYQKCN